MKLALQKLNIVSLSISQKFAALIGNLKAEQNLMEHLSILHTQMRVEREHNACKQIFDNI